MDENPRPPGHAMHVMALLLRRGGAIRIGPLIAASGLSADDLVAAINALQERLWVKIVWRGPLARRPEALPERFREVRRIATTRIGRHCYPFIPKY